MATLSTDVLVIGGGATGAGVAWDAALRGFDVVLVDRADLAEGTSGRFHGLLHSGGRYAVKDPRAADECIAENRILKKITPDSIEDIGGFFVTTPFDDPAYADVFAKGCADTGVDCEEIDPAQALREEPLLNPGISRVFRVPDANIDVWKTVWAMARGIQAHGGRVLPYHAVVAIHRSGDQVTGARLRGAGTGEEIDVEARVTVNAPPPPPPPPPSATEEELFAQNVKDIYFDYDKYDVRADQQGSLQGDAQFLQQHPNIHITVEGHCDERGSTEYNLALGTNRADAVKNALIQAGVGGDRIKTISYGKEKPFCTESNESCWQQNRRGHFVYEK